MKALLGLGVTPDRVFAAINVAGVEEIGLNELADLYAMYQGVKNGDTNVDDVFPPAKKADQPNGLKGKLDKLAEGGNRNSASNVGDSPDGADQRANPKVQPDLDARGQAPGDQSSGADGGQSEKTDDDKHADLMAEARKDGAAARGLGRSRKSVPARFRSDEQLLNAWLESFDGGVEDDN